MRSVIFFLLLTCLFTEGFSQCPISSLGQNPSTAFPVCGTAVFHQQVVPVCLDPQIRVPGCMDGADYGKNPYWYKFTCYQSGTLGFLITPLLLSEDYDWQLYDITGLDPTAIYSNISIVVTGNWSGTKGLTGAKGNFPSSGVLDYHNIQCASDPADNKPTFETMPPLIQGHNYLLLVSHYEDTQSGYDLSFGGGTAVITDPVEPHLKNVSAPCDGTEIKVRLNKKMKCKSLVADGSDFKVISPAGTVINPVSASSAQCGGGFDLDSLSIFMPAPLTPGTYKLLVKNGADGNTLKDNCDRTIPVDEEVQFTVYPLFPTPLDSISPVKCAPRTLELVFKKKIKCSSIDEGGGDFYITGPYPVTILSASGNCVKGEATKIILQLSAPIQNAGNFVVHLQAGPDGNTILDECDMQTPLPAQVSFRTVDTVNANFGSPIIYSCTKNTIRYNHNGANGVNMWHWTFGTAPDAFTQNPVITYTNFLDKTTSLIVSNGVCSDTATSKFVFNNYLHADFAVSPVICPENKAVFTNKSLSNSIITNYKWTIGNGSIITVKDPAPQTYIPLEVADYFALPELIITNDYGCRDTTKRKIQVVYTCFIAVPSAFTPNGDGLNDYLYPLKAYKSSGLSFSVYNRFGQRVFYSTSWLNKWDGKYKTIPQDSGTYVWMLDYTNSETGKHIFQKGTTVLIR